MKVTISTDERYIETEIMIYCSQMNEDIERVLAAIRLLDMKIIGQKEGKKYFLEASDIMYAESTDKRTFLYTLTNTYESYFRLYELEEKLTGKGFLRISKNCLINIVHIASIENELYGRLILTMPKGIELIVSRQYASDIKQKLEVCHG